MRSSVRSFASPALPTSTRFDIPGTDGPCNHRLPATRDVRPRERTVSRTQSVRPTRRRWTRSSASALRRRSRSSPIAGSGSPSSRPGKAPPRSPPLGRRPRPDPAPPRPTHQTSATFTQ